MIRSSTLSVSKFLHSIGTSAAERQIFLVNSVVGKAKQDKRQLPKILGLEPPLVRKIWKSMCMR